MNMNALEILNNIKEICKKSTCDNCPFSLLMEDETCIFDSGKWGLPPSWGEIVEKTVVIIKKS